MINPPIRRTEKTMVRRLKYLSIKDFTLSPKILIRVATIKNLAEREIADANKKTKKLIEKTPADTVKTL